MADSNTDREAKPTGSDNKDILAEARANYDAA